MSVMNEEAEGQTLTQDYIAHQWQVTDGNHPQTLEIVRLRSTQRRVFCRNSQQSHFLDPGAEGNWDLVGKWLIQTFCKVLESEEVMDGRTRTGADLWMSNHVSVRGRET